MKNTASTKDQPKNKVFGLFNRLFAHVQSFYHQERMKFILGFTSERFAYAELYVNGILHPLTPKNFGELEKCVNLQSERLHFKKVSSFMLAQMWASRRTIKFQSHSAKLEVLTYWYF